MAPADFIRVVVHGQLELCALEGCRPDLFTRLEICLSECDRPPSGVGNIHRSPFTVQSDPERYITAV
eukprot:361927-Chlamydomonas_euryale.AAC.3